MNELLDTVLSVLFVVKDISSKLQQAHSSVSGTAGVKTSRKDGQVWKRFIMAVI